MFHNLFQGMPAMQALFNIQSPLDLVGVGFFFLLLYVVVGGTYTMIRNQVKYALHAVKHRTAPDLSELHSYTKSLIKGTAPELLELQATPDLARQRVLILSIVNTLEVQDRSPVARAMIAAFRKRI